jgi:hypothetical protein
MGHQSDVRNGIEVGLTLFPCTALRAHSRLLLDFNWLHRLCVKTQFSNLNGEPPRDTGMISSTSALHGFGVRSVLSTGLPHIAHVS